MARLSDQTINTIKQSIPLAAWLRQTGHALKPHGKDLILNCPHHQDDSPSLVISPDTNLWHCMGACQEGGSIIDWVMKTEQLEFREAVRRLAKQLPAGIEIPAIETPIEVESNSPITNNDQSFTSLAADSQVLLQRVVSFYHETLLQQLEAIAYLESRGLNHPELISQFKLGFANRSLLSKIRQLPKQEELAMRQQLQALGVLRKTGHEHLNGSLVVPVCDGDDIKELYGRKINQKLRVGTAYHLYLPGPHEGVWNSAALGNSDEVIVCESLIDAMTFWVNGFKQVTASYGTSGFTDDHLTVLITQDIKRVLIAYDRDEAGETAAIQLAKTLENKGIACFRVNFPKGMDANEYALTVAPAYKSLQLVLSQAVFMGQGDGPEITSCIDQTYGKSEENCITDDVVALSSLAEYPKPNEVQEDSVLVSAPVLKTVAEIDAEVGSDSRSHTDPNTVVTEKEVSITFGHRRYRVRGLKKNLSYDQLKINLLVSINDLCHVDTFDFYNARHRLQFVKQAAMELAMEESVVKKDLGKLLLKLEALQEQHIEQSLTPEDKRVVLSPEEKAQALTLLQTPDLLSRIVDDFDRAGVVGEETNKLMGYLACVSRKLENPLAIMIQSTSAAGKSSLMDAVLALMPEEDKIQYSAMTGQSLFYMGKTHLKHKILAIAEEEGAHNASYALKLLQSEGEVSIASTGKDAESGNLVTQEYTVEGPVMLMMTTTAIDIDEELLNRCVVLTVNESIEQTQAIHAQQRAKQTLAGMLAKQSRQAILQQHKNAQRLIQSYCVVNPYAEQLTFLSDKTRTRRDHMKYLQLINSIALLHQYQREIKTTTHNGEVLEYLEVTWNDIAVANVLAHDVLGSTLDELPAQTRKLLVLMHGYLVQQCQALKMSQADYRFTRKEIRDVTGWGNTQLKIHMARLVDLEYMTVHSRGIGQTYHYELLYDGEGQNGGRFVMNLIDTEKAVFDGTWSGLKGRWSGQPVTQSGSGRAAVGRESAGGQASKIRENASPLDLNVKSASKPKKTSINGKKQNNPIVHPSTTPSTTTLSTDHPENPLGINIGTQHKSQRSNQDEVLA